VVGVSSVAHTEEKSDGENGEKTDHRSLFLLAMVLRAARRPLVVYSPTGQP
jgi:hypothetical protein